MEVHNKWGRLSPVLSREVHSAILAKEYAEEKGRGYQIVYVAVACPGGHPRDADYKKLAKALEDVHTEYGILGSTMHPSKCMGFNSTNTKFYILASYVALKTASAKKYLSKED